MVTLYPILCLSENGGANATSPLPFQDRYMPACRGIAAARCVRLFRIIWYEESWSKSETAQQKKIELTGTEWEVS